MSRFHTLKVIDINEETNDCKSIAFEVPENLTDTFNFIQGQYLTLRSEIKGEDIRRSYSLCSSPLDGEWRVAVKKIPQGRFSTFANDVLKVGDMIEVMPPMGNFYTEVNAEHDKHYVAFAAGSGITPILSIMKTVLQAEPKSQFTLIYGNKNTGSIIFHESIEGLKNKFMGRLGVYYMMSREILEEPLLNGRISAEKCQILLDEVPNFATADEFFLCGPESMINTVSETLKNAGINRKKIHFELFTSSDSGEKKTIEIKEEEQGKSAKVSIRLDGTTTQFDLAFGEDNILDAAMKQGADVPFACKGGVCCTCKARLVEGEVEMLKNYALEPEEVEAGFILTCQAFPKTKQIMVDFDDI